MYELIKLAEGNYYVESPAKIGLVVLGGNDVALIDSGNDKDAGKKIKKILDANGWNLKMILNTHSHADHIGGNQYLQKQTGCKIYAPGIERDFTCHPVLEPSLVYGANPIKELRHKFMMAQPSDAQLLSQEVLPDGMQLILLPGHSFDMVGFRTKEDVVYLADSLSSELTLEKYKVGYIYDVAAYLETLQQLKQMKAEIFVPSHAMPTKDIAPLAQKNIDTVMEIADTLLEICSVPKTFEEILEEVFRHYGIYMTFEQHALIGSTIRSYLTWLKEDGKLVAEIEENRMVWKRR